MQSLQEEIVAAFIRDSFGAQCLFVPLKQTHGKEPSDLFWYIDGTLVLFYLNNSRKPACAQIEHNNRQARGFLRRWRRGMSGDALRGLNVFGDTCFVPKQIVVRLIVISVISAEVGVVFHSARTAPTREVWVSIPDKLFVWLSAIGGTIVDLLQIITKIATARSPVRARASRANMERLESEWSRHVAEIYRMPPERLALLSGIPIDDRRMVAEVIGRMRMTSSSGKNVESTTARKEIVKLFGDMSSKDFFHLSAVASLAIARTEPPVYKNSCILKTIGLYHNFVIAALSIESSNFQSSSLKAVEAANGPNGEMRDSLVIYAYTMNGADYRVPMIFAIPDPLPRCQTRELFDLLAHRLMRFGGVFLGVT